MSRAVTREQPPTKVVYPGGFTQRQHAIQQAQQWQRDHATENDTPAYQVIVGLLDALLHRVP